jgi:D-apionate oxidoisomerase
MMSVAADSGLQTIALFGAGGKMGLRIARALRECGDYRMCWVEPSAAGRERLARLGLAAMEAEPAARAADAVILAVPDGVIGPLAQSLLPWLRPGALVITLDPAAAFGGKLPPREDIAYFITHPSHPPLYGLLAEPEPEARRDYWGHGLAHQALVNTLVQGSEADYANGDRIARHMFGPIVRSHRITLEQMALLEPALSETLALTCLGVIRHGMDEVIRRGVPAEAAFDFLTGHIQVELAILFGQLDWQFSDGAKLAAAAARRQLFQPNWEKIFEPEQLRASVAGILGSANETAPGGSHV